MRKYLRYIILATIILVFFILAPLIVIYVSGKGLGIFSHLSRGSGILDIKTKPSGAKIYLNGQLTGSSPATVRFLKQNSYDLKIEKEGYFPWEKQLFVTAGEVIYAGLFNETVTLLPQTKPTLLENSLIKAYVELDNKLIYVNQNNQLIVFDLSQSKPNLPQPLTDSVVTLIGLEDSNYLLAKLENQHYKLLDLTTVKLITLPPQFDQAKKIEIFNGIIFALIDDQLFSLPLNSIKSELILDKVSTFGLKDGLFYIARFNSLNSIKTYNWDGKTLTEQLTILSQPLPQGKFYQLLITNRKIIFLQVDQVVYKINQQLDPVVQSALFMKLQNNTNQIIYRTPSEILYADLASNQTQLFYRSTSPIKDVVIDNQAGFGYMATNLGIDAIELDNRNSQNRNTLVNDSQVQSIFLTSNRQELIFVANNKLFTLALE